MSDGLTQVSYVTIAILERSVKDDEASSDRIDECENPRDTCHRREYTVVA